MGRHKSSWIRLGPGAGLVLGTAWSQAGLVLGPAWSLVPAGPGPCVGPLAQHWRWLGSCMGPMGRTVPCWTASRASASPRPQPDSTAKPPATRSKVSGTVHERGGDGVWALLCAAGGGSGPGLLQTGIGKLGLRRLPGVLLECAQASGVVAGPRLHGRVSALLALCRRL